MTLRRILSAVFVPLFLFVAVVFPMEKSYAAGSLDLVSDSTMRILAEKVGTQRKGTVTCSAYCIAYAKTIITPETPHQYNEYWNGTETNGSVKWAAGNYTKYIEGYLPYNDGNVKAVLQKMYSELNQRRLPILYVSAGRTQYMHWVLVVGYKNVIDENSLTQENFIVIDSNDPTVKKTLGASSNINLGHNDTKYRKNGLELSLAVCSETVPNPHKHSYTGPYRSDTEHWWQCSCGAKTKIAAHTFGDWTITKGASTTETGTKTRKCSGTGACGYEQTAVIPVLTFTHTNAKVKMNYAVNIKKTPYASGESVYKCSVGETFDIGAYGLNSYGNVWYQILSGPYAGNYIYSGETELVKYVNDLSITINIQIPTNIVQGTACQPSEIIKSRHNITNVTGAIYSAETYKLIYSGSVSPNVHDSYSTANTAITEALKFHLLAPGEYIYVVTATATTSLDFQAKGSANGTGITCLESETFKKTLYSKGFTVSAAPHEHTYGDWSKDGTNHWHECTCGDKTDVAEHSFGEWTVTKEASTTEPGSKTRSCSVCGFEETVEIPVLSHTHSYGTDWKNNETSHWHECTCGDKADVAEHSFGEWTVTKEASTTEPGSKTRSCSACGFEETLEIPVLSHTHSYGTDWKNNETSHWHECTCGDKADMAAHSFRWIIDRAATATQKGSKHEECTVCGYRRAAVEIPATGTTTGGTTGGGSHWHPSVTTTPVPVIVIPPKTGDMTIWQSILHFLGIR